MKVSPLDHSFPHPHQKGGDASAACSLPMRSVPRPQGSPRVRLSRTLPRAGTFLVLVSVATLLAVGPAHATWGGNANSLYAWSNGAVLCVFNDSLPSVAVSNATLNGTGMGASLDQITELSPAGTAVSTAVMSSVAWEPNNTSSAQSFVMNYSQTVPVTSAAAPFPSLGAVQVSMNLALARSPMNAAQADRVAFQTSILNWPWQSGQDTLALVVPLWSAYPASEHLLVLSPSSARVVSVLSSNGQPMEYFQAGASANSTSGAPIPVSAHTTVSAGVASTTITLGASAGGKTAITYAATLGITPSTHVLGLPLYDYAAVAGGAGLVALVVGVGTRRVRRQPSDLTYVEDPE